MNQINWKRMGFGGLTAGLILFVLTGAVNAGLLNEDFQVWMHDMGSLIHPPAQSVAMLLWTFMSLIYGFVGVGIYVFIRPRFGAGPKTALFAGFILWILSKFTTALDLFALGVLPQRIIVCQLISSFVIMLIAISVGAWIYRETETSVL